MATCIPFYLMLVEKGKVIVFYFIVCLLVCFKNSAQEGLKEEYFITLIKTIFVFLFESESIFDGRIFNMMMPTT